MRSLAAAVLLALSSLAAPFAAHAQELSTAPEEAITSFDSRIMVNADNSVDVTETIGYETGPQFRHGIYRDIRTESSQGRKMTLSNVSVTDPNHNPYQFTVSSSDSFVHIKIGDPNVTFSGANIYVIAYHASKAVGQTDSFDEIYWNATGDEWNIPIYRTRAEVVLPPGVQATQNACYYGPHGSTDQCGQATLENGTYVFAPADLKLPAHSGMTVAVGFPKGIVAPYSAAEDLYSKYLPWLLAALLPIAVFFIRFVRWWKTGGDDRPTGTIIPYYDVDDDLTPIESVGIALEKLGTSHISAEIIYLATKGYLKIVQKDEKILGVFKNTGYEFTQLKPSDTLANQFDKTLLDGIFRFSDSSSSGLGTVRLSDLQSSFAGKAAAVIMETRGALRDKGYYKTLGRLGKTQAGSIVTTVFMIIWFSGFVGGAIGAAFQNMVLIAISLFVTAIIMTIFNRISPAKTDKGITAKEHILGLREYLQIAEKDRLEFHNAPERKPETFERFLPYAMALGVADIWAKEFEGIYMTQPEWYSSSQPGAFSAIAFTRSLASFSSVTATTSSPRSSGSSGSGGGGSSGGGGGGGGGGGW